MESNIHSGTEAYYLGYFHAAPAVSIQTKKMLKHFFSEEEENIFTVLDQNPTLGDDISR